MFKKIRKSIMKSYMNTFSQLGKKHRWEGYAIAKYATTEEDRKNALLQVSKNRYNQTIKSPLDIYFKCNLKTMLEGKDILEVGSNHGGASLAYFQLYNPKSITGIDTTKSQADISNLLFKQNGITSNFYFTNNYAENLEFKPESFDAIISFDVFEHVKNLSATMSECYRVLKPNGKLFLAFPSYYQPIAHHLTDVTLAPCVQWFFKSQDIVDTYYDILDDNPHHRDKMYHFTNLKRRTLESWEKLPVINGMTLKKFRSIIAEKPWVEVKHIPLPLFSVGEFIDKYPLLKIFSYAFWPMTKIPILEEFANHRIVYILTKGNKQYV